MAGRVRRRRAPWAVVTVATVIIFGAALGCGGDGSVGRAPRATVSSALPQSATTSSATVPDELPALQNAELPFKYPAGLYARKVQGNVTLKLFIDRDGRVLADSTRVEEPSGYPALDSAALAGARDLRFVPAKAHGEPMPLAILFPVYFRHPEARPLPGDTIMNAGKSG